MTSQSKLKPKLVFFQYRYDENLPEFLLIHKREHIRCLSESFDVTVVNHDGDYQEICDKHEPDLVLFESGVSHPTCRRLTITNIRSCPQVPKLGLHNADSFCIARAGFLSDMDHWGVETFFAISTTAAEHTPEMANNLFVWPNCIDPETYRDYGQWKNIPVLFTGNTNALYPWRQQILKLVSDRYPSLICPHPGYDPGAQAQVLVGERYARMINASLIVPACGTVAREAVRKHFEIPGCRSCLLTERSAALEAAGFVDMENCVFADDKDVLDKLSHLFQNPAELQAITDRGYELVQSRHTLRNRDQIFQWYSLQRTLQPNQRIVQSNPFGQLLVVDRSSGIESTHVRGEGLHLSLLRTGNEKLAAGQPAEAERLFLKCMNYMRWMPEPKLGIALSKLQTGDARTAHSWLSEQIQFILAGYGAADPDPVEWAYYVISLLCLGDLDGAGRFARQFAWLQHPELNRTRAIVKALEGGGSTLVVGANGIRRRTIHRLPVLDEREWLLRACKMLDACGQQQFAERLKSLGESALIEREIPDSGPGTACSDERFDQSRRDLPSQFNGSDISRSFRRQLRNRTVPLALKRLLADGLHRIEAKFGYFLPYHVSEMRRDELFSELRAVAKNERIRTALLIGVPESVGSTEALLAGMTEGRGEPAVICVGDLNRQWQRFEKAFAGRVECHCIGELSPTEFSQTIERVTTEMKRSNQIDRWDAVLIAGSILQRCGSLSGSVLEDLHRASVVVFDDINSGIGAYDAHDRLLRDPAYVLAAHNPGLRSGYAIFKRTNGSAFKEKPEELATALG